MNFIFWQNILSMHQSAFIKSLAERHSVILVAEKEIEDARIIDGWEMPNFGNVHIEISPNKNQIIEILDNNKDAIHVFSGIKAFPAVHYAFRKAIKKKLKVGIITESANQSGIFTYLRRIKTIWFGIMYSRNINFILAMGNLGVEWFAKNYFQKKVIFPFMYVVEDQQLISHHHKPELEKNIIKFIVIAQLIKRKGIDILVKALQPLQTEKWVLKIIGDGKGKKNIINLIKKLQLQNKIFFTGALPHRDAMKDLSISDLLILPSRFDGWGAVVNEAIIRGIPVIVSNKCGASCLVDGKVRGSIFEPDKHNLDTILKSWIMKLPYKQSIKDQITEWSKRLSGESCANYFLEIIHCVYENKKEPKAPWL